MNKKRHQKLLTAEEFKPIMDLNREPVELKEDTLPVCMKSIPKEQRCHVYASGSYIEALVPQYGRVVGGVDVFRDARSHPEPVNWNKDHYTIIKNSKNDGSLLMYGPDKDNEHWINERPNRFKNVKILTLDVEDVELSNLFEQVIGEKTLTPKSKRQLKKR